jgi:hypothetical protein
MLLATGLGGKACLVPRQISDYEVIYPKFFDALDRFARHEYSTVKSSGERLNLWSRVRRYQLMPGNMRRNAPMLTGEWSLFGIRL